MPQQHMKTVKRLFDAVRRRDLASLLAVLCCLGTFPRFMASDRHLLGRGECGKHRPTAEEQGGALTRVHKLPVAH